MLCGQPWHLICGRRWNVNKVNCESCCVTIRRRNNCRFRTGLTGAHCRRPLGFLRCQNKRFPAIFFKDLAPTVFSFCSCGRCWREKKRGGQSLFQEKLKKRLKEVAEKRRAIEALEVPKKHVRISPKPKSNEKYDFSGVKIFAIHIQSHNAFD